MGVRQIQYCYEPAENLFFTPWLQPGEQKRPKIKRLQPLKRLNAKAAKEAEKDNHRAKAPVKKRMTVLNRARNHGICRTPDSILR